MKTTSITRSARRVATATVASGLLAAGALTLSTAAASAAATTSHQGGTAYSFRTIDNPKDPAFNQLLGINDEDQIAGYFGSGAAGAPNKGYTIPPFATHYFINENFPGSVQTQVTGLNNRGVTVGFWSSMNNANMVNDNFGFVDVNGHFRNADFPTASPAIPPVDQLLGVNDAGIAVGFYTDANNVNHGYEYNIGTNRFSLVTDPYLPETSLTAAAINDEGDVAGFYTNAAGNTDGFLLTRHGQFTDLAVPGATATDALGVNRSDEVVGVYSTGPASAPILHGFTWTRWQGFRTVDDPHGIGTTTVNGVNDYGQLVGFYVDATGNTDGFLASPRS